MKHTHLVHIKQLEVNCINKLDLPNALSDTEYNIDQLISDNLDLFPVIIVKGYYHFIGRPTLEVQIVGSPLSPEQFKKSLYTSRIKQSTWNNLNLYLELELARSHAHLKHSEEYADFVYLIYKTAYSDEVQSDLYRIA